MAIAVALEAVEDVLRPWLGTLFLSGTRLCEPLCDALCAYSPGRQTLEECRDSLETLLLRQLNALTRRTMTVFDSSFSARRLRMADVEDMTDDLMGLVFDSLPPIRLNFDRLNEYSLRIHSLSALRVLYQRYRAFQTPEETAFMCRVIRALYPPQRYASWLKDDFA